MCHYDCLGVKMNDVHVFFENVLVCGVTGGCMTVYPVDVNDSTVIFVNRTVYDKS